MGRGQEMNPGSETMVREKPLKNSLDGLSRNDLLVLQQLSTDARADRLFRGYAGLADVTGIRRASVHDCIAALERKGLIRLLRNTQRLTHIEVVPLGIRIIVPEKIAPCAYQKGLPPYKPGVAAKKVPRETTELQHWIPPEAAGL